MLKFCLILLTGMILVLPIVPRNHSFRKAAPYAALLESFKDVSVSDTVAAAPVPAPPPDLTAKAAAVYYPEDDVFVFQKNADAQLGIASITKIMTALAALERVGARELLPISAAAIATEGDEGRLVVGEHLTLENLIVLMMTASSNDAAAAVAEHVGTLYGASTPEESQQLFVRMMNEKARQLDLTRTHFENPTGLDSDEKTTAVSNTSTAADVARLVAHALRYPPLRDANVISTTVRSEEGTRHDILTTHELLLGEPGIRGGKTGFTDLAGGVLATVAEVPLGKLSIVVVLGSTRSGRFTDTVRLLDWLRAQ